MGTITEALQHIPAWAGSVPGWVMAFGFLGIWWKGLPAVLDAWSNRLAKEREHGERELKRLEEQISAGDERHSECMEGQKALRQEMAEMQTRHAREMAEMHAQNRKETERLQNLVTGLMAQMRQLQMSATRSGVMPEIPPEFSAVLKTLEDKH